MSIDTVSVQEPQQGKGDAVARWDLQSVVSGLRESRDVAHNIWQRGPDRRAPSREALTVVIKTITEALFPRHFGRFDVDGDNIDVFVEGKLNAALDGMLEQVHRGQAFVSDGAPTEQQFKDAVILTRTVAAKLPEIRGQLISDLRAAFVGDPAATSFPEILIGYPGMTAIIHHRVAHLLHNLGATLVARLIAELAHSATGIDIHPGARLGEGFFIDHGTGVVIGETAIVGDRVRIYQAVTLGARHFPTDYEGKAIRGNARHPIIEDDVIIYAGATILGRIVIGSGSTIGGNVWLTEDVPANSFVTQASVQSKIRPR